MIPPADPHPVLHQMHARRPLVVKQGGAWYLTRYADVQRALLDPAIGRQVTVHEGVADPLAIGQARTCSTSTRPTTTRLRRLMAPAFGLRTVARLERRIDEIVTELVAGLHGEVDVIKEVALPLPILVMADLVGFPPRRRREAARLERRDAAQLPGAAHPGGRAGLHPLHRETARRTPRDPARRPADPARAERRGSTTRSSCRGRVPAGHAG